MRLTRERMNSDLAEVLKTYHAGQLCDGWSSGITASYMLKREAMQSHESTIKNDLPFTLSEAFTVRVIDSQRYLSIELGVWRPI